MKGNCTILATLKMLSANDFSLEKANSGKGINSRPNHWPEMEENLSSWQRECQHHIVSTFFSNMPKQMQ